MLFQVVEPAPERPRKMRFAPSVARVIATWGPLVEGPGDVYICGECIELCQSILDQETKRRGPSKKLFNDIPTLATSSPISISM